MSWYEHPLHRRAESGGEIGIDGRFYRGGAFEPFYVPRPEMPQIDEEFYDEFLEFCRQQKVSVSETTFEPERLKPHQRVDRIVLNKMPPEVRVKHCFVSVDLFILDGNHRWKLHVLEHTEVPCYEIMLPFEEAIALMFAFPKTYTLAQKPERN